MGKQDFYCGTEIVTLSLCIVIVY